MILVDGDPAGRIDAADRGLHYGDGLFETLAVHRGEPLCLDLHLERLARGCHRLGLPPPPAALVAAEARGLAAGRERAVLKVVLTRGPGGRGYAPPRDPRPTRIVTCHDWPGYPAAWPRDGIAVAWCRTRLGSSPALAGMKHLNRLEQVLARAELEDRDVPEGLMRDGGGRVISGTMTNLFAAFDGRLLTPPVRTCGVAGVVRGLILDLGAGGGGPPAREGELRARDLRLADEIFLCNSVAGIWPVRRLEDRELPPGPLARRLQDLLLARGALVPE